MDIFAHGLYGGAGFINKSKKSFWTEPPTLAGILNYIHVLYSLSHSLIVFTTVFLIVWLVWKQPMYEMLAWGLHIVMDIPTHTSAFFPTPFLYPVSSFYLNGVVWGTPIVFFSYWGLLLAIYLFQWLRRKWST